MRILIAAVGKLKEDAERTICERYRTRFDASGRGIGLGPLQIEELSESRAADAGVRKRDEAARLLSLSGQSTVRIALDVKGAPLSSSQFAAALARHRDDGCKSLALLIGGPDGHGEATLHAASSKLSLGPMTLPHGLARVVLIEQLYRAATILSGHPYHRA